MLAVVPPADGDRHDHRPCERGRQEHWPRGPLQPGQVHGAQGSQHPHERMRPLAVEHPDHHVASGDRQPGDQVGRPWRPQVAAGHDQQDRGDHHHEREAGQERRLTRGGVRGRRGPKRDPRAHQAPEDQGRRQPGDHARRPRPRRSRQYGCHRPTRAEVIHGEEPEQRPERPPVGRRDQILAPDRHAPVVVVDRLDHVDLDVAHQEQPGRRERVEPPRDDLREEVGDDDPGGQVGVGGFVHDATRP